MFQMRVDSRLNANSQELVLTLMFELCGQPECVLKKFVQHNSYLKMLFAS